MNMPATRHQFTVDAWHAMIQAGVFGKGQRVELLDGGIYEMTPTGPPHQSVVDRLTHLFVTRAGNRAIVRVQGPVTTDRRSEPQPDLMLLRWKSDYYREAHPDPGSVLLVVEVADTSLAYDRAKLTIYASAGLEEAWIVDLEGDRIEIHRQPRDGRYGEARWAHRGEQVRCAALPALEIAVDDILG